MLANDAMRDRQAKPRALPYGLRRVERIEDAVGDLVGNRVAGTVEKLLELVARGDQLTLDQLDAVEPAGGLGPDSLAVITQSFASDRVR